MIFGYQLLFQSRTMIEILYLKNNRRLLDTRAVAKPEGAKRSSTQIDHPFCFVMPALHIGLAIHE